MRRAIVAALAAALVGAPIATAAARPAFRHVALAGPPAPVALAGPLAAGPAPPLARSWAGVHSGPALPPDTNLAVGETEVVQITNDGIGVFAKTGQVLSRSPLREPWSAIGGPCGARSDGDPIAVYDRLAHRFVLSQFAIPGGTQGFWECIAVSRTASALDGYNAYAFRLSNTLLPDYPKLAVWGDSYYLTTLSFDVTNDPENPTFVGPAVYAFDRRNMLDGVPAGAPVSRDLSTVTSDVVLPATIADNVAIAPSDAEFLVASDDQHDRLAVIRMAVDWSTRTATVAPPTYTPVDPFDGDLCAPDFHCIRQPRTGARLDAISDRLLWSLPYRRFGDHTALVANQAIDVDGSDRAGIRWYELRPVGPGLAVVQTGNWSPDATARWMGSIAIDGNGAIALGYSAASRSVAPSIRYATRRAADPPGALAGEMTAVAGLGSQTTALDFPERWGDYSAMMVDPVDDCTFWYTSEYLAADNAPPSTRVVAFRVPPCTGAPDPDATAPLNPPTIGTDHREHAWSRDVTLGLDWGGAADDGSGPAGTSLVVDHLPATLPDTIVDTTATAMTRTLGNATWYVHVRTRDAAGNWAATATHAGPFFIDTRCTMGGTDGADRLVGTRRRDRICALAGDDRIVAGPGDDLVFGGGGNDVIDGGAGRDWLIGGAGNDRFSARDGERDLIDGGPGRDTAVLDRRDRARHLERRR